MDTNQNNISINSFIKGMNTDTSVQMMQKDQYISACNIRVFPIGDSNQQGSIKSIEGVVQQLTDSTLTDNKGNKFKINKILASDTIRQYGVLILENPEGLWKVVRVDYENDKFQSINDVYVHSIFTSSDPKDRLGGKNGVQKISMTLRYEDEDNIKAYIADGKHPLMVLNIMDESKNDSSISSILSYSPYIAKPPVFCGLISGNMVTSMVQYSYRLYNKYGTSTDISCPTKLIPIVVNYSATDAKKITGEDKDYNTGAGVRIRIDIDTSQDVAEFKYIQIYRIQYVENGQQPTIDLIIDQRLQDSTSGTYYYSDTGSASLQQLTLEEYNGLAGIHIVPKVLESKFDYLFAANIKDEQTIMDMYTKDFDARSFSGDANGYVYLYDASFQDRQNYFNLSNMDTSQYPNPDADCCNIYNDMSKEYPEVMTSNNPDNKQGCECRYDIDGYYGGTGKYVSWRFVVTELMADINNQPVSSIGNRILSADGNIIFLHNEIPLSGNLNGAYIHRINGLNTKVTGGIDMTRYFEYGTNCKGINYSNPAVSYAFKSLKRDELYRYGIILYNGKGDHTSVKWIADIRTPNSNYKNCNAFVDGGVVNNINCYLSVRPLGIEFKVDIDKFNDHLKNNYNNEDIEWDDSMYITHYEIVRCNRTHSDICNISQGVLSRPVRKILNMNAYKENIQAFPYTPTGLLTTANFWLGEDFEAYETQRENEGLDKLENSNYENHTLYQFVSPEILYQKDYMSQLFDSSNIKITPIEYLFHQSSNYSPDDYFVSRDGINSDGIQIDGVDAFSQPRPMDGSRAVYMQLGYSNMQFPMVIQESNSKFNVGDDTENTYINGISMLSIFQPAAFTIPTYYGAVPTEIKGDPIISSEFSGDIELTESYMAPNHTNSTKIVVTDSRNNLQETRNVYGYSKLYHQSYELYLRDYATDASYYTQVLGSPTEFTTINLRNELPQYSINDFQIADEISWSEMFEDTKDDDGNVSTQWKAADNLQSVGGNTYINVVLYGMQDFADGIGQLTSSKGLAPWYGGLATTPIGPAGRCALISIDDDNIFYKTIATDKVERANRIGAQLSNNEEYTASYELAKFSGTPGWSVLNYINNEAYGPNKGKTTRETYDQIGSNTIFRNSIGGTYLCNIRQSVTPYNGYDYNSRQTNSYYSYGDIYNSQDTGYVFDGDCVIAPMEYVAQHKYYYPRIKYPAITCFVYSIPVETSINLYYTHGFEFSRNYTASGITNLQIEPSDVNGYFSQSKPLYNYNTVYSCDTQLDVSIPSQNGDDSLNLTNLDYRCYHSNVKSNNESMDSWCVFMPNNYIDVDTRYGEITELRAFKDKLVFWQDNSVGLLSVNERSQITDDNSLPLILGTGGVLSRYDYIDQTSGMSKELFCDTMSMSTLYWFDDKNKELKSYGGNGYVHMNDTYQTDNLSRSKCVTENPLMFYDQKYSELVSKVLQEDESLAYNERYSMFTSIYEIPFGEYLQFENTTHLVTNKNNDLQIYKWNEIIGDIGVDTANNALRTCVQYVINQDPLITKTFDNQEIVSSEMYGYDSFEKNYFNINHTYTWETDLNYSKTNNLEYTDREGNFRYAIPRALDKDGNIVAYGNRMRGKYMICTIENSTNNRNASISYIITKYRKSWT